MRSSIPSDSGMRNQRHSGWHHRVGSAEHEGGDLPPERARRYNAWQFATRECSSGNLQDLHQTKAIEHSTEDCGVRPIMDSPQLDALNV